MFNLLPWRWTHWILLVVGPLFVVTYLGLLTWGPVDGAIQRLSIHPGQHEVSPAPGLVRAEALLGLTSLLMLTPFAGMVALFLLLFAMVIVAVTVGPLVHALGLPNWVFILLFAATSSYVIYAESEAWAPWFVWALDRLVSAYLIPFL